MPLPPAVTLVVLGEMPTEKSGAGGAAVFTVQVPICDQALAWLAFATSMNIFFAPS